MKLRIKFGLVLIPLLFIGALLPGCRKNLDDVCFFIYNEEDTFIGELMDTVRSNISPQVSYEVFYAGNSQSVQNQQILDAVDSGCKLLVINAADRLACSSIVERCSRDGVSIIFFNREPLPDAMQSENVYYVGAKAESLGRKQAEMVVELFNGGFLENLPKHPSAAQDDQDDEEVDPAVGVLILKGEQGHQDAEMRTEQCILGLNSLDFETNIVAIETANWNRDEAFAATAKYSEQLGSEIQLIMANNDDMALGAIDYMTGIGVITKAQDGADYNQEVVVVGVDGTAVGLEAVEQGLLYGTVNNDTVEQVNAILTLANFILLDKSLEDYPYDIENEHYIYIDGEAIIRSDLDDFTVRMS